MLVQHIIVMLCTAPSSSWMQQHKQHTPHEITSFPGELPTTNMCIPYPRPPNILFPIPSITGMSWVLTASCSITTTHEHVCPPTPKAPGNGVQPPIGQWYRGSWRNLFPRAQAQLRAQGRLLKSGRRALINVILHCRCAAADSAAPRKETWSQQSQRECARVHWDLHIPWFSSHKDSSGVASQPDACSREQSWDRCQWSPHDRCYLCK